jgi:hypothetical protein
MHICFKLKTFVLPITIFLSLPHETPKHAKEKAFY